MNKVLPIDGIGKIKEEEKNCARARPLLLTLKILPHHVVRQPVVVLTVCIFRRLPGLIVCPLDTMRDVIQ